MSQLKPCSIHTPPWFVGHWRDWHRGHGCDRDDGKPRSPTGEIEIAQHEECRGSGFLTDAELRMLRAATTSGNGARVRALDELAARRAGEPVTYATPLTSDELLLARVAAAASDDLIVARALDELATRRAAEGGHPLELLHAPKSSAGPRCTCGGALGDCRVLADRVRRTIRCPRCGSVADDVAAGEVCRWSCGHWIARGDAAATLRGEAGEPP